MKPDRTVPAALFGFSIVLSIASVTLLPFFGIRANRTATGVGAILFLVSPRAAVTIAGSFVTALAGFLLRRWKMTHVILASRLPQARVSFGIGFLALLGGLYGAMAYCAAVFGTGSARAMNLAFLAALGSAVLLVAAGVLDSRSIVREFTNRRGTFLAETVRHGVYAFGTTTAALISS